MGWMRAIWILVNPGGRVLKVPLQSFNRGVDFVGGMLKVEQLRDDVVGLRPVYSEGANATEIICANGSVIIDYRRVETVVKVLLRCYAIDLQAQRQVIRNSVQRKSVLPFYLPKGRVFIPLKMRQPISSNDQVYGYVDLNYLGDFTKHGRSRCSVPLSNGLGLEILSSKNTALESEAIGKKLAQFLKEEDKQPVTEAEMIMESGVQIGTFFYSLKKQLDRIEQHLVD
jgi:hypothetical protein